MITNLQKWLIFFSISLLLILMNFDITAVNLALASIALELHLNIVDVQWIISAYLLGGASLVMLGGLLGDIYGHKKIFLSGAVIFTFASLGVALSSSEWLIIFMRLVQGFGAALAWPLAIVIVRKTFVKREAFAMGLITAVMGVSLSIGPPLGGGILDYLSWRWIFLFNIPLGILVFGIGYFYLQRDEVSENTRKIHMPSALTLVLGLLLLIFGINEIQRLGIDSPIILSSLLGGIFLLIIFCIIQIKMTKPLVNLKLFMNKALGSCFLIRFIWQVGWIGLFLITSLLFQNVLGYTSLQTSLLFLICTVFYAVIAFVAGKLLEKFSARIFLFLASIIYIIAFAWFAFLTANTAIWQIMMMFVLFGTATGIGFPALLNITLEIAPNEQRGMVSGVLYGMLFIGGAVGATIVGALINSITPKVLANKITTLHISMEQTQYTLLNNVATGVRNVHELSNYFYQHQLANMINISQQSYLFAFSMIMVLFILFTSICAVVAWLIK